jgi:hypothetical protein
MKQPQRGNVYNQEGGAHYSSNRSYQSTSEGLEK